MNKFLLCILFSATLTAHSQSAAQKEFDSLYYEITVNISSSNPTLALHLADSLYLYASSDQQELRALMLSVDILEKQERYVESLETMLLAMRKAEKSENYNALAKIYGYLSTQSRLIGVMDEGRNYIEKGIAASKKMKSPEAIESYQAMAKNELAEYAIEEGDFEEALELLELSLLYYKKIKDSHQRDFMKFRTKEVMARCYMGMNMPKEALKMFREANSHLEQSGAKSNLFKALIQQGLGEMFMLNKELDSAAIYLKKALVTSEATNHNSFKELVYGSLTTYYRKTNSLDSAVYYNEKQNEIIAENRQKNRQLVNTFYNQHPQDLPQTQTEPFNWWILGGGFLAILGGIFVLINTTPYRNILKKNPPSENRVKISLATRKKLKRRLKKFEDSKKFLSPNMRFSILVTFLDTNPKYLNHYLKENLNTDYNTYINNLRINHIVKQLKSDASYRKYKISHLAKESGFSSHSNFSANFKRITHLSPSEYIEKLKSET